MFAGEGVVLKVTCQVLQRARADLNSWFLLYHQQRNRIYNYKSLIEQNSNYTNRVM